MHSRSETAQPALRVPGRPGPARLRWPVLAAAALAALLALPVGGVIAKDKDPDWPEITQAERDFKTVPGDPEASAVLLRNTRDGKIVVRGKYLTNILDYHWRLKVLTDKGREFGEVEIPARKGSKVEGLRARTIKSDGTIVPVPSDQIFEKVVTKAHGVRTTEIVFNFPAMEPGAILEYVYERESGSLIFVTPWYFSGPTYTVLSRVTQAVPIEAHYQSLCYKCPNPDPPRSDWKEGKIRGKLSTYEMKDIPANRDELLMPPVRELLPRLEMTLSAWDYQHWDELARDNNLFTNWNSVARYFNFRYRRAYMLDETLMRQTVAGWTTGLTDADAKLAAVFRHVQADFRYEDDDLLLAQTSSIADLLKAHAADNEEKAVLLTSALRALGLNPVIGLVAGLEQGQVYANYYSFLQFDHAIVGVPRADKTMQWMDPTATWTPFGVLPWRDSGAPVLILHDDNTGDVTKLPLAAAPSKTSYTTTLTPLPDGKSSIEAVVEMTGDDAADMRNALVPESEADRRTRITRWTGNMLEGSTLQDFSVEDLETIDKPLRIRMKLEAPALVTRAEDLTAVRGCALDCYTGNPIPRGDRRYPIYIDGPMARESQTTIKGPEGAHAAPMPKPVSLDSIFGTYKLSCAAAQDGSVTCSRSLNLPRSRWPETTGPALRTLFDQIVQADRTSVAFNAEASPAAAGGR
jgi:hypothetical protein